jgi:hypothetical protein
VAGTTGTAGTTGSAGTGGATGSPIILSLTTNVTSLTPSDSLVVTAVVTHPQGIAQIIGGTLSDPPAGGTYGAFQVTTTAGSYSLTLTWQQIKTVRDITTPVGGASRMFRAQFYDQAGHTTTQDFSILLRCTDSSAAICSGTCFLFTDPHACGRCGHDCTALASAGAPMPPVCSAGKCIGVEIKSSTPVKCQSVCSGAGLGCTDSTDTYQNRAYYSMCNVYPTCATTPTATYMCNSTFTNNFVDITCNCAEP